MRLQRSLGGQQQHNARHDDCNCCQAKAQQDEKETRHLLCIMTRDCEQVRLVRLKADTTEREFCGLRDLCVDRRVAIPA